MTAAPDPAILDFLRRAGLVEMAERPRCTPLTGGVSSDIWLVETDARRLCVKRALAKLRVAADWSAPVERNALEAAWLRGVAAIVPDAVPAVLAEDAAAGMLAMDYLPPESYRVWKADLLAGHADAAVASAVGDRLGRIHAAFADDPSAPATFSRDDIFHQIRLEPYLEATARAHPRHAERLAALVRRTASTKRTVVHGDVSPKNILVGPRGPVFLDAECAWFGDPAFDAAFCLNHLLLKCLARPAAAGLYLASFDALWSAYLDRVDWEVPAALEARVATLLPGLLLARVDGKSPVEYIDDDARKDVVRRVAGSLLAAPGPRLAAVRDAWTAQIPA